MVLKNLRLRWLFYVLAFLLANSGCAALPQESNIIRPAKSLPATTPWDLVALSKTPNYEWSDGESPVRSLYYEGQPYKDKPTRVFAYYGSPATLNGKDVGKRRFPAVVLVHGGGGTAFKEWVQLWAKRGYAAIAMDLAGCGPDRKRLADGGPGQGHDDKFDTIGEPVQNQWTYHAVANVILAHSLIRSFEEVDADRTAVTGISWGGYLTCIVAGLDNRFKAAVPVCTWLGEFAKMGPQQTDKWVQLWDPSMYIALASMPVFFVNGTNDFAYPLDSYAKTYGLVRSGRNLRITVNMPHGHQQGWAPEEIGLFVDEHLKNGIALPEILGPKRAINRIHARVKSKTKVVFGILHYTTGKGPINKREWQRISGRIEGSSVVTAPPPEDATIWFLTVADERGAVVSSEVIFVDK
ncbi:MAG: alpha/beta hydrolase family protein [Planctomycetota bacterium]|jgi:pimeloyl-ACP methyl ester carboxylesterase